MGGWELPYLVAMLKPWQYCNLCYCQGYIIDERKPVDRQIKRGDILYAELDPVVGSEQGGKRPVLIIQNDTGNKYSPTVIVAAITSKGKVDLPTHLPLSGINGLEPNSVLLLEQMRTVDKQRLGEYIAYLGLAAMRLVDASLIISLGIKRTPERAMTMSLCRFCVQSFSDSECYSLRRVDREQLVKEKCTICNTRNGFDFEVLRQS